MMIERLVYFILFSLLLIKGGSVSYVWLSWTAIVLISFLLISCFYKINGYELNVLSLDRWKLSHPLSWLALFVGWIFCQLVLGLSHDLQATQDKLLLSIGFFVFLLILCSSDWQNKAKLRFIYFVVLLGAVQAFYGLFISLTQLNKNLWMDKVFYLDKPTGTLVNANHYCAYLSLVLIVLVAYIASRLNVRLNPQLNNKKRFYVELSRQLLGPAGVIAILIFFAIMATKSVGGIGSLLIVSIIFLMYLFFRRIPKKQIVIFLLLLTGFIMAGLLFASEEMLKHEWSNLSFSFERRYHISAASLRMALDNGLFGVGGGGFYSSFSQYRDLNIGNSYYNFAHNDYLQFWIEYGLVGVILLVGMLYHCLRINLQVLAQSKNMYRHIFAYASIYSTLVLAIHSLVDFPLQIPAYALLYLSILFFNALTWRRQGKMEL